jgi:hypothetical protein
MRSVRPAREWEARPYGDPYWDRIEPGDPDGDPARDETGRLAEGAKMRWVRPARDWKPPPYWESYWEWDVSGDPDDRRPLSSQLAPLGPQPHRTPFGARQARLLESAVRGDRTAWDSLVAWYMPDIQHVCFASRGVRAARQGGQGVAQ